MIIKKKKITKRAPEKKSPVKKEAGDFPIIRAWGYERAPFGSIRKVDYFIKGDKVVGKEVSTEDVKEIVLAKIRRSFKTIKILHKLDKDKFHS